jgi:hypothetical protein
MGTLCIHYSTVRLLFIAILLAPALAVADQTHVQFCWAIGKFDNTVYFAEAENREDRQASFEKLLEISGIDHHPVQCRFSDLVLHDDERAQILKNWLESEFETINTTFLSDLDY